MTPDDYDRLYEESRKGSPFSNSDEGYGWMANWCDHCINDKPARNGDDTNGCPLILVALMDRTPIQWLDQKRLTPDGRMYELHSRADQYHCIEYRHEDDGPADPRPIPTPPGQGELLPREPFEGYRMLTAAPDVTVTAGGAS